MGDGIMISMILLT